MKVNKYIFEVEDMNKQKLPEVEREKKGGKWNSGPFLDKRRERKQTKDYSREEAEEKLSNAGLLTLCWCRSSRWKKASPG